MELKTELSGQGLPVFSTGFTCLLYSFSLPANSRGKERRREGVRVRVGLDHQSCSLDTENQCVSGYIMVAMIPTSELTSPYLSRGVLLLEPCCLAHSEARAISEKGQGSARQGETVTLGGTKVLCICRSWLVHKHCERWGQLLCLVWTRHEDVKPEEAWPCPWGTHLVEDHPEPRQALQYLM
jgi:hypothetical protein